MQASQATQIDVSQGGVRRQYKAVKTGRSMVVPIQDQANMAVTESARYLTTAPAGGNYCCIGEQTLLHADCLCCVASFFRFRRASLRVARFPKTAARISISGLSAAANDAAPDGRSLLLPGRALSGLRQIFALLMPSLAWRCG